MQLQLTTSRLECETLRAAIDNLLKNQNNDWQVLFTLGARVLKLEVERMAPRARPSDFADKVSDRDRYKVLLQRVLAAWAQGLFYGYTDIIRRAHGSQDSIRVGLGFLPKESDPLSLS